MHLMKNTLHYFQSLSMGQIVKIEKTSHSLVDKTPLVKDSFGINQRNDEIVMAEMFLGKTLCKQS